MNVFKLLASLFSAGRVVRTAQELRKTHRAGDVCPKRKQAESSVEGGPYVQILGNGLVKFHDAWHEPIWSELGFYVLVPRDFVSDGYSIPKLAWVLAGHPFGQAHMMPAYVHDYLCNTATSYSERVLADAVFFHLLYKYNVPSWKRVTFYVLVRCWGRYMWKLRGHRNA